MQLGLFYDRRVNGGTWIDCVVINTNLMESRNEVMIAIGTEAMWVKADQVHFEKYIIA